MAEKKAGIPLHEQISDWVKSQIEDGVFKLDEKLPSENDLRERFDVSRVTIRRALQTLEDEQYIYRCQGLGSFVKDNRTRQTFMDLTDFAEDMKSAGLKASSIVLKKELVPIPDHVQTILNLDNQKQVMQLDRLRLGNDEPIAFDITYIPVFYAQLLDGYDMSKHTIYSILENEYEITIEKGCYRIEAENADAYLAEHLNIDEGAALLLIDRLTFTMGTKPIYYQKRYYRPDKLVYQLMVDRKSGIQTGNGSVPVSEVFSAHSK